MTLREREAFERQNALPRATSGTVAYYFKRQTKYPPRIYVFMQAELWCDRNRRPMGLYSEIPFLTRPMNREEIEYHHFNWRLCYHQYEDWDQLLFAEQQEADQLDAEVPGTGSAFLEKLKDFRFKYPLSTADDRLKPKLSDDMETAVAEATLAAPLDGRSLESGGANEPALPVVDLDRPMENILGDLIAFGDRVEAIAISAALDQERNGLDRKAVLIALTTLYRNFGLEEGKRKKLDLDVILRKAEVSAQRTRLNFVRRVWRSNRLFALAEVKTKYPDCTEEMLLADLRSKPKKVKSPKRKPVLDLRRSQLQKLSFRLHNDKLSEKEYHDTCCRMVMLQNAHDRRLPVPLAVKLNGETKVYSFNWQVRETVVKSFVAMANTKGMTHDLLAAKHREMCRSSYSY